MKTSSPRALAQYVDQLTTESGVALSERAGASVTLNNLSATHTKSVADLLAQLDWAARVVDDSGITMHADNLQSGFAPFTVSFAKPEFADGPAFLSTRAFYDWLTDIPPQGTAAGGITVRVAACTVPFRTKRLSVCSWDEVAAPGPCTSLKSPRELVRSFGDTALVPRDVAPFLLDAMNTDIPWGDVAFVAFVRAAYPALVVSLAGEVEPTRLTYIGPPRLTIAVGESWDPTALGSTGFVALQRVASWVYELAPATELRHRLFVHEFARLADTGKSIGAAVAGYFEAALDGARITYHYGLHDQSKDAIKSLTDLRKAVMEETSKISETARQLALNTAGALFYGLGLLAGKLTTTISPWLLDAMGILGALYLCTVIGTNWRFLTQQAAQRKVWRKKLYRYLTDTEYKELVLDPVGTSETLVRIILWSALVLGMMMVTCVIVNDHTDAFAAFFPPSK